MSTVAQREEIEARTKVFLVEEFEVQEDLILPHADMKETLALDSLDYVDLVVVIQDNFGVKLTAEDFQRIGTFQDFYEHIEQRIARA
ncbi:MAG: acyl carrier protein [Flavobacteriales bacterium]|jgi:acyl carrier protein|nr:acyl carrier protein [Flavobacteriales bacterium]MBK7942192.1 acyl carrier protein [Flavobacteriales bacterium]MBK8949861.1 acyl carrier protein [Flavobacteriales bacterium]MBK9701891.1 acyl carrier protein [Flavobacteriales bacterium]